MKTTILVFVATFMKLVALAQQAPFVTVWKTDNPGSTANNRILIPTWGTGYNFNVEWEDTSNVNISGLLTNLTNTSGLTITFPSPGVYRVKITGNFPVIRFNNSLDRQKIINVEQWGDIIWGSMETAFWGCNNLNVTAIDSLVLPSNCQGMFKACSSLIGNPSFNNWNTNNVTNMFEMFAQASLFNQPVANWNTQNVFNMGSMFKSAASFNQDLGTWILNPNVDLSEMLDINGMNCLNYSNTLIGWVQNNPDVTNRVLGAIAKQYYGIEAQSSRDTLIQRGWIINGDVLVSNCPQNPFITVWKTDNPGQSANNQIRIPISGTQYNYNIYWEDTLNPSVNGSVLNVFHTGFPLHYTLTFPTPSVYRIKITGAFPIIHFGNGGDNRKIIDIEQWGDIVWSSMENAFIGCDFLNVSATDLLNLPTNCSGMFKECGSLIGNPSFNNWNTSNVTNMSEMFSGARFFNQPIGNWNTSNVTNMRRMFHVPSTQFFSHFNQNIDSWNTSNVTNMSGMFSGATSFNQYIGSWNTNNVIRMDEMFFRANSFNQDISSWNTSNVNDMGLMFGGANSFNQDISNWNTHNVTKMDNMFSGATSFNQSIGSWNTSNVTNMAGMFNGATSFNQPIGDWNTNNLILMGSMFLGATSFNQPIGNWNTSNVTNMFRVFRDADSFNQDISNWNTSNVNNMGQMFFSAINFNSDISNWDVSNVTTFNFPHGFMEMFQNAKKFNQDLGNWNMSNARRADNMFENSGLSVCNLDNIIYSWSQQNLNPDVSFGIQGLTYSDSTQAHLNSMINQYNWNISGGQTLPTLSYINTSSLNSCNPSDASVEISFPNFKTDSTYYVTWSGATNGMDTVSNHINIVNLNAGQHNFVISDDGVCQVYSGDFFIESNITTPNIQSATVTELDCQVNLTGAINIIPDANSGSGLAAEWTYNGIFFSNSLSIDSLNSGEYLLNLINDEGCQFQQGFVLESPNTITIETSLVSDIACFGFNDGEIIITASGGTGNLSYLWTGPNQFSEITTSISSLSAGQYSLIVTDQEGCTKEESYGINEPLAIEIQEALNDITCFGFNDGEIIITASGGTGNLSYHWAGPNQFSEITTSINSLSAGQYSLVVTDQQGCTKEESYDIFEPLAIEIIGTVNQNTINTSVSGGVLPYSYSWIGPDNFSSSSASLSDLSDGVYILTITDADNCTREAIFNVAYSLLVNNQSPVIIKAYPNPTKDYLTIDFISSSDAIYLEVLDLSGKILQKNQVTTSLNYVLDIQHFPDGVYHLRILHRNSSMSNIKIIKQ